IPAHDVHFFAADLVHDVLHADTLHAHAGSHRVDAVITHGAHGNLGAGSRFPGRALNFDGAFVNFRYFQFEQFAHQVRMGAAHDDGGSLHGLTDLEDQELHALARGIT